MANLGANSAINMSLDFFLTGFLFNADPFGVPNATAFSVRDTFFNYTWAFQGTGFTGYVDGVPQQGTVTGLNISGAASLTLTNVSLQMPDLLQILVLGTFADLTNLIFAGADVITALNGSELRGLGGDDLITGGLIDGDLVFGGQGNDTIFGRGGMDALRGEEGDDIIDGGADNDFLFGEAGDDNLSGGSGNDELTDGAGNDTMRGGDGDDNIISSGGIDILDGGAGTDTVQFSSAEGIVIVATDFLTNGITLPNGTTINNFERHFYTNGPGLDILDLRGYIFGPPLIPGVPPPFVFSGDRVLLDFSGTATPYRVNETGVQNAQAETLFSYGTVAIYATGGSGGDFLFGGIGDDILNGGAGVDNLFGGDGDDILFAGAHDSLNGGFLGSDTADFSLASAAVTVSLNTTSSQFTGGANTVLLSRMDNLRGSAFNDVLTGADVGIAAIGFSGLDNILSGGDGDDILSGLGGGDTLFGELGDDTLHGGAGADALTGGGGIDTASYAASFASVTINLSAATGAGSGGDAAGDTFVSIENITGSAFNDTLTGRDFVANTLNGGDGNDVLSGGTGGADVMNGGAGIDTLDYSLSPNGVDVRLFSGAAAGGSANGDTYSSIENIIGAATKTDTLAGDANANQIWGGGGNETITGRENTDTLHGEAGNDTLLGGADSDVLIGGIGADTLGGGSQDDTADYSASDAAVTVNLQTGSGSGGHAQGDVLVSIEDVIGSAFADVIVGKNNVWDNVFDGRGGNDTYTGGLGNDVFVFRLNEGADTITDFVAGGTADAVQLVGFGASFDSFAEITAAATQIGADTIIDFGAGQTLTLQNVTLANLSSGDFIFGG